jgi:hypothetical protein
VVVAFGVLSVWWKTSVSVSTLFRVVLPQIPSLVVFTSIPRKKLKSPKISFIAKSDLKSLRKANID